MTNMQKLKYRIELFELLENVLVGEHNEMTRRYEPNGEQFQVRDLQSGELLFKDGEPIMRDRYALVDIPWNELEPETVEKLQIMDSLRKILEGWTYGTCK